MFRTRRYAFQRHGPKRLSLRMSVNALAGTWDELVVRVDAVEIGRTNRAALREGVEYKLFDHSVLRLWLELPPSGPPMLNVTRNGHPLPGSFGDPLYSLRSLLIALWVFAGIQILAEAIVIIPTDRRYDRDLQVDYWVTAVGVIIVLLCILAWRRSLVALIAACVLFMGECLLALAMHFYIGFVLEGLFPAIGFVWLSLRAIQSLIDLKTMALPVRHQPEPMHPSNAA
jgi:hypothetical protein